jgi:hypothetical protein
VIVTNNFNLPTPIYNAVSRLYPPQRNRFSVTALIGSPQQRMLQMVFWDKLQEDASDRLWLLLGSSVHYILEKGVGDHELAEEKIVISYRKHDIVGKADLLDAKHIIIDFKVTSVWSFILGNKQDWTTQLNLYAWLYRKAGYKVKGLKVAAILRDWSRGKIYDKDYPNCPFQQVVLPLWSNDRVEKYIDHRLKLHVKAEKEGIIPFCTPEERWAKDDVWAVKKVGNKRALPGGVCNSETDADTFIAARLEKEPKIKLEIDFRPGEKTKCANYCRVAAFCKQYQDELTATMAANPEEAQAHA